MADNYRFPLPDNDNGHGWPLNSDAGLGIHPSHTNGNGHSPNRITGPDVNGDNDSNASDAETYTVYQPGRGAPVDPPATPDVPLSLSWADLTRTNTNRVPIIPAWLTNRAQRRATLRAIGFNLGYWLAFHAIRSPKYALKAGGYALLGVSRMAGRLLRWATAEQGNWSLRQHAADTNDAFTWQSLNRTRAREAKARWIVVAFGAVLAVCGGIMFAATAADQIPTPAWYAVLVVTVLVLARFGRPADKPITDRVTVGQRFTKLTAEMVRTALVSLNLSALKEPGQVEFVHPGIHRDGPGWLARVNLPAGMEAVRVLDRRGALSSALRLPVDQVWPSAGPDHAGQLDLWVGYQPASKMGQPRWSLAADNAVTSVFDEHEFGTDERQRPVRTSMFARSFLLGGQPGSGKSYAARSLATVAALDPTVEFKIAEFKGTGDFLDFELLCSTYIVGVDDNALGAGARILTWALAEAERRGKRILAFKKRGLAPEGKVTPELARQPGSGLHPIVIVLDEVHELFAWSSDAADEAERAIKRARALGIIFVLATQIPDKTSLPPNITRCVTNRWCLSVNGQVENDMILGTGAYKRGITGTVYRPEIDAGWGVMTGLKTPTGVRSQYPDQATTKAILARALALRGGKPVGGAGDLPQARDLLADLVAVSASNGQHWATAAEQLTAQWPHAYPAITPEALSDMARKLGVPSADIKIARRNWKGYRLDTLRQVIAQRVSAEKVE
ncbi:cell division protein FtsK [Allorhizocola rhizosphaerae]|uniref:cell division protein FtsK n=1 Tax=Allorhizocola rhizosphaerae TaxID=1872709 RepID=UPI000E3C17B1|nr:cell division protein FtsK [Allorhizocola rhizosphaerae]